MHGKLAQEIQEGEVGRVQAELDRQQQRQRQIDSQNRRLKLGEKASAPLQPCSGLQCRLNDFHALGLQLNVRHWHKRIFRHADAHARSQRYGHHLIGCQLCEMNIKKFLYIYYFAYTGQADALSAQACFRWQTLIRLSASEIDSGGLMCLFSPACRIYADSTNLAPTAVASILLAMISMAFISAAA